MSTLGHWCLSERCPLQKAAWWENVVEEEVQLSNDADAGAVLPFTGIIASMYWQNEPNVGSAIHQVIFSRDKARALQGFRDCGQARTDRYMGVPPACHALAGCSRSSRAAD